MSTKLTGYVWDGCAASGMKLSSVAIMARLADFSNDEGVCWPSIETIACIRSFRSEINETVARRMQDRAAVYAYHLKTQKLGE